MLQAFEPSSDAIFALLAVILSLLVGTWLARTDMKQHKRHSVTGAAGRTAHRAASNISNWTTAGDLHQLADQVLKFVAQLSALLLRFDLQKEDEEILASLLVELRNIAETRPLATAGLRKKLSELQPILRSANDSIVGLGALVTVDNLIASSEKLHPYHKDAAA
jgi:hypothetical protein